MARARVLGSVVLALLFFGAIGIVIWWSLTQLQKEVTAALVTAIGAVIVVVLSRYFEQRRRAETQVRDKKAAIYENFIGFWIEHLMFKKEGTEGQVADPAAAGVIEAMSNFTKGALINASDDVVGSWSRYRRRSFASQPPPQPDPNLDPSVLLGFETVLLSIRKEFGHRNRNLQRGDLVGLFVNDVDVLLAAERRGGE